MVGALTISTQPETVFPLRITVLVHWYEHLTDQCQFVTFVGGRGRTLLESFEATFVCDKITPVASTIVTIE